MSIILQALVRDYSTYHGLLQLLIGCRSMDDLHHALHDIERTKARFNGEA